MAPEHYAEEFFLSQKKGGRLLYLPPLQVRTVLFFVFGLIVKILG
jgi:hypothetical protein